MHRTNIWLALTLSVSLAAIPAQVLAMGSGSDSTSKPKPPKCKEGYVYSSEKKRCVRKSSDLLTPSDFIAHGWQLARGGKYSAAIAAFQTSGAASNPEALNGLGYSHRKLGHLITAIDFYHKALEIEPDYVLARSYLGEGYVQSGRIDLARLELTEIAQRCGKTCPEYIQLMRTIETGSANDW